MLVHRKESFVKFLAGLALLLATLVAHAQEVPYKYKVEWEGLTGDPGVSTFTTRRFDFEITSTTSSGGGGGVGKPVVSPVKLVRKWDELSPFMLRAVATGVHFRKVTMTFGRTDNKGNFLPAVQYIFEDVTAIGDHAIGADHAVEALGLDRRLGTVYETNELEEITLDFSQVTIVHLDSGNRFSFRRF